MKTKLTELAVKKMAHPASGQVDCFDTQMPNFGMRCSPKRKSFFVYLGGAKRRKRKTLGRYPDLSLADARKLARQLLANEEDVSASVSHDYLKVRDAYLADCRQRLRGNTLKGYELYLGHITFKGAIGDVTQGQVIRAIEKYTQSPSSQNYAFTTFKVFFNWAVRRQYITSNPLAALKRPHRQAPRERVLSDDELKTLLTYTMANRGRFNDIVTLLVLTGQRKGEIANLRWSEIDDDQLVLPPERTKNKREHVVPLGSMALELLHSIEGGSTFVFGTPFNDAPFNGWSRAQRSLLKATEIDHFTLHDLRRTFSTIHARIGTPIHVTEKLLNHASGTISGVAAVYNRHSYLEEMEKAVEMFEAELNELLGLRRVPIRDGKCNLHAGTK
ncbi:tyrosine-type recombinase/integrase [Aliiroseovarius sp.]|uniref:tyrosine-type recombinase/integrase n=1 Tax=Aliiroseovarius sp. TaxID=1872442 RepID=UPI003BAC0B6F